MDILLVRMLLQPENIIVGSSLSEHYCTVMRGLRYARGGGTAAWTHSQVIMFV